MRSLRRTLAGDAAHDARERPFARGLGGDVEGGAGLDRRQVPLRHPELDQERRLLDQAQNRRPQLDQGAAVQVAVRDNGVERRAHAGVRELFGEQRFAGRGLLHLGLAGGQVRRCRRVLGGDLLLLLLGEQTLVVELHRPLVVGFDADELGRGAIPVRFGDAELAARLLELVSYLDVRDHGEHRAGGDVLADAGRYVDQEPRDLGRDVGDLAHEFARVGGAHGKVSAPRGDGAHRHCLRHRRVACLTAGARLGPEAECEHGGRYEHDCRDGKPRDLRAADPAAAPGVRAFLRLVKHGHGFVVLFRLVVPPSRRLRASGAGVALAFRHGAEHVLEAVGEDRVEADEPLQALDDDFASRVRR